MIIHSFNKGDIDTDKLPDAQAELAEEVERIRKFVKDRNGEMFFWVKVPGKTAWVSVDLQSVPALISTVDAVDLGIRHVSDGKYGAIVLPVSVIDGIRGIGEDT